jgi:outer membrane immunogenic protein
VKIKSSIVIAAAAGSTLAPNAEAIAQPRNTPNAVASPVYTWTGFYIGGHLGAAWQKGETNGAYFDGGTQFPFYNATSHTGFMGGGQIGYNWQSGIVVYGLEADISTLTGSGGTVSQSSEPTGGGVTVSQTSSNNIEWFGTVRARLGFAFGTNTLVYATGGWAYGHVKTVRKQSPRRLRGWRRRRVHVRPELDRSRRRPLCQPRREYAGQAQHRHLR